MKLRYILVPLAIIVGGSIAMNVLSTVLNVASVPSRVINKTLETGNVIRSYEWYHDANGVINARLNQIEQFKSFLADSSDDEKARLRVDLAAVQQSCRELIQQYNANSEKITKSVFNSWSLPDYFDNKI